MSDSEDHPCATVVLRASEGQGFQTDRALAAHEERTSAASHPVRRAGSWHARRRCRGFAGKEIYLRSAVKKMSRSQSASHKKFSRIIDEEAWLARELCREEGADTFTTVRHFYESDGRGTLRTSRT